MVAKPVDAKTYRLVVQSMAAAIGARRIVEVGVFDGLLSRLLAGISSVERLTVVDPWAPYKKYNQARMEQVAQSVIDWADKMSNVTVMRAGTLEAAQHFTDNSIDFFHTDANKAADGLKAEIMAWLPKIRVGGLMTGDNYEFSGIASVVDEIFPTCKLSPTALGRIWWVRK